MGPEAKAGKEGQRAMGPTEAESGRALRGAMERPAVPARRRLPVRPAASEVLAEKRRVARSMPLERPSSRLTSSPPRSRRGVSGLPVAQRAMGVSVVTAETGAMAAPVGTEARTAYPEERRGPTVQMPVPADAAPPALPGGSEGPGERVESPRVADSTVPARSPSFRTLSSRITRPAATADRADTGAAAVRAAAGAAAPPGALAAWAVATVASGATEAVEGTGAREDRVGREGPAGMAVRAAAGEMLRAAESITRRRRRYRNRSLSAWTRSMPAWGARTPASTSLGAAERGAPEGLPGWADRPDPGAWMAPARARAIMAPRAPTVPPVQRARTVLLDPVESRELPRTRRRIRGAAAPPRRVTRLDPTGGRAHGSSTEIGESRESARSAALRGSEGSLPRYAAAARDFARGYDAPSAVVLPRYQVIF